MSSKLNLRNVHEFAKVPTPSGASQYRMVRTNPALRLAYETNELYIQYGQVFTAGGDLVKELPAWFHEEVSKCTPQALAECGWKQATPVKKAA